LQSVSREPSVKGKELKDPKVLSHAGDVPIQEMRDCEIGDEKRLCKFVIKEPPLRPLVLGGDRSTSHPVVRALTENLGESETWGRCEKHSYLN
jgi:arginase